MTGRVRDLWYLSLLISFGQYVLKWFWPNLAGGPRSGLSSICVTLPGSLFVSPLCKVGDHVGFPCVRNCSSDRNSRSLCGSAFCSQFLCEFLVGRVSFWVPLQRCCLCKTELWSRTNLGYQGEGFFWRSAVHFFPCSQMWIELMIFLARTGVGMSGEIPSGPMIVLLT